ncbi:uncharacterized protein J7T55_007247 [Diaporthe amygdali]|uniref:uncharacterized protein n=1 Tax=Phomopsis amygdali TaxID=1214568 RepID=UPI0022FEC51E|nr:uncharacterized protein J7T55_007247 [Diaporthe amygdali]KAJ0108128.1 uncharacterized protein J7T55_007247 [Diaporthe amygdali]
MPSKGGRTPTRTGALRWQIEGSLVTSILNQRFLPTDKLDEIFNLSAITGAIRELTCGPHERINLADTIHKDGKRVFAMLTYNRFENYITEFRKHGVLDRQLPLSEERAEEIMGSEDGRRLALDFQWMFLPYVFPEDMSETHLRIDKQCILPFISEHQIATGAFGVIDKVCIPPSQHKFIEQGAEELQIVRKRLVLKGQTENFEREDKCLRLLNRLKHPNIIPFWGSYTYREEQNFLFPYVGMNLGNFLKAKERHGEFRWDFTFYSALTGLASALSNTHRLFLKESEHDVDFEGIGYHHDLRPPNVLVCEDTFILADFGLGGLKDSAALSHTPYKIISGDYISPECTDMEENPQTVNRSIDVWAFGCLILEIVTYMLKGAEGVEEFRKKRLTKGRFPHFKDAGFYQPHGEIKQEVLDWIEDLKSYKPQADLVHRLFQLSLNALQVQPSERPVMDEMHERLQTLSLLEHFDSIERIFCLVGRTAEDTNEDLKHHIKCLQFAQKRFETWGQVLGLNQRIVFRLHSTSLESSVKVLRSLFHILREEPDKRDLVDSTALRSLQHQMDRKIKELWDALPAHLLSSANEILKDKASGSGIFEQVLSLSQSIEEKVPLANPATSVDGLLYEFEKAAQLFKDRLPDSVPWDEILKATSIEDVYDTTDKLQDDKELRNLSKMRPYLERLCSYAGVVQDAIRESNNVLTFLWGPLALLLQWSSENDKAYSSIIDAVAEVGQALPDFQSLGAVLSHNSDSKEILLLFFKDIFDFYLAALQPFSHPGWMHIFDRSWPRHLALVLRVTSHIERLSRLMRIDFRLEHIQQEHEFRKDALEVFRIQTKKTREQEFHCIKTALNPCSFDETLYHLRSVCSLGSGDWLFKNDIYTRWLDGSQARSRVLWLRGIPGAGKTVLSCILVDHLKGIQPNSVGFAFLTYQNENISALSIMHCFIFQLAERDDERVAFVCESTSRDLKSNLAVATDLLESLIRHAGTVYLVVDGIDKISGTERCRLARELLSVAEVCEGLRIVLSSLEEADLKSILEHAAVHVHIQKYNEESISAYVSQRSQHLFDKLKVPKPRQIEIRKLLGPLARRAEGMFLYARLTMDMVEDMHELSEIKNELVVLPKGLDAAYLRIITRLSNGKDKRVAEKAWRLLGWIACSPTPLTVEEAGQALVLQPCNRDQVFNAVTKLDVVKVLGPIVETVGGYIRFVHFTAKDYISSAHLGPHLQLINTTQATMDLARRCIDYLCQRHHDLDLTSKEVSDKVFSGQYSFHAFSTQMWFELSCQYLSSAVRMDPPPNFVESLQMLWQLRKRRSSQSVTDVSSEAEREVDSHEASESQVTFEKLKGARPLLHQLLCEVSRFRTSSFFFTGKSVQGFVSETMRQKHLQEGHRTDPQSLVFDARDIPMDVLEPCLSYLIREDRVNDVRMVLSTSSSPLESGVRNGLRRLAASAASPDNAELIIESIKGQNLRTLEYLLSATSPLDDQLYSNAREYSSMALKIMCQPDVIAARMLRMVARTTCSVTLARYLLEQGADINFRRRPSEETALQIAARHDTAEGAEMMRLLLLSGADPEADTEDNEQEGSKGRKIRDEVGPLRIKRWLGKSWDALVEETKQIRRNREVAKALVTQMSEELY